jgi:uncharacterized protein YbjQ (UPF0145 family)
MKKTQKKAKKLGADAVAQVTGRLKVRSSIQAGIKFSTGPNS